MFGYNSAIGQRLDIIGNDGSRTTILPGSIHIERHNDDIGWLQVLLAPDSSDVEVSIIDDVGNRLFRLYAEGGMSAHGSVTAFGRVPVAEPPSITGSRAAMGIATYEMIQALADIGYIIDGTVA